MGLGSDPSRSGLWIPKDGLLIPASAVSVPRRPVETEYILVTLGLEELTGRRRPWDEIVASLRWHNQRAALTFLSTLDAVLENDGTTKQDTQLDLAQALLPEDLYSGARQRIVQNRRTVAFSNQLIWMLEKLVLAYADPVGDASITEVGRRELGTLLLALADYLDENVRAPGPGGDARREEWELTRHLIRSAMLHAYEDTGAMLSRVWTLIVDLPDHPALRGDPSWVDLAELLERHDGINPKSYLAAGTALTAYYGGVSLRRQTKPNPILTPRTYYASTKLGPDTWDSISAMTSLSVEQYAAKTREEDTRTGSAPFAFQTMRERPLVQYGDQILPLSQRFLRNKFTDGLLWVLRDRAARDRVDDKVNAFLGRLFEQYIYDELAQAHDPGGTTVLQPRVHGDVAYRIKKQKYQSSDIVVNYGYRLVVIEVALTRPRLEATQIRGLQRTFEEDINHILVDNARQLDRNLRALLGGRYTLPGVNPTQVRRIYPVIVTLGHMPEGDLAWNIYERALERHQLLRPANLGRDVARLQLLTAEDVEILHDLIHEGTALADLLDRKSQQSFQNVPFKNFLFNIMPERMRERGSARQQVLTRVLEQIREVVWGKTPSEPANGPLPESS